MTHLVKSNGSTMKIKGNFNQVKSYFLSKNQKVQQSRTCKNGEDVFFNGKMMGVLLFDGHTEKQDLQW